jgi:hypothetical protein
MRGLNPGELWGLLLVVVGGLLMLEGLGVFALGELLIPIVIVLFGLFLVLRAFASWEQQPPKHTPRPHS